MKAKALYEGIFIMTIHVVKPGDTLSGIAATYGVSEDLLAIWNALSEPYALVVGQAILILTPAASIPCAQAIRWPPSQDASEFRQESFLPTIRISTAD